jgi:hypothetical protein
MWPFRTKRHLRYDSVYAWRDGEHVPHGFINLEDPVERDRFIRQYGELRQHLFWKHARTLSAPERRRIKQGKHPSRSHAFAAEAEPYAEDFRLELAKCGHACQVEVGFYHWDRIVLMVDFDRQPNDDVLEAIPSFFHGFEIKYGWSDEDAL